jgi:ankyrin repeat protein
MLFRIVLGLSCISRSAFFVVSFSEGDKSIMRLTLIVLIVFFMAAGITAVSASDIEDQVKQAIASGNVVPERDLAPLIQAARNAQDKDEQRDLIEAIGDFGAADGDSPITVKRYLLEKSTSFLIDVAGKRGSDVFLRWEAMAALRSMNAPRSVLIQLADMCDKDPDDFIKSRGEILRNYAQSLPETSETKSIKPTNAAHEQEGIAFLKSRKLGVSLEQLRESALAGKADEVAALLKAGVDPNGGPAEDSPLNRAISGCSSANGQEEGIVDSINALIAGGANVKAQDANGNTPMLHAGQYCGAKVAAALIAAGADINASNKMGMNALLMALILNHFDTAEALVAKGAKLTAQQAQMTAGVQDPRGRKIIQKALKK